MKLATIILSVFFLLAFGVGIAADEKDLSKDTVQQFDEAPKPIDGLFVEYPESAKRDEIEGTVLLSVRIESDGSVSSVTVAKGVREDLDQAAVQAVKQSQWIPAKKDNVSIAVKVTIPIQFKLKD